MINILVTGGNGQLASCIKDIEEKFDDLNFIYTGYNDLDICSLEQVNKFFESNKVNYCVNCAAYTAVDKAEEESEKAFEVNATGAKNLAIACNRHNVVLIHISTDFIFEGNKDQPYHERDVAKPISVYGASKLQGELEIQKNLKEYFIIRTSWLYSEHGNNFMKTMLRLAQTRDEISVINDQIGTPTYAGDLAHFIVFIINSKAAKYGVYNYSNEGGGVSWFDFAKEIFELSNNEIKVNSITSKEYPTAAKRPAYSVLNKEYTKFIWNIKIPSWKISLKKALNKTTINL